MISSMTPDSGPIVCSICGRVGQPPAGDAPCSGCRKLLRWFRDHCAEQMGVQRDRIRIDTSFARDLGADSLDTAELAMELEEAFDIDIPENDAYEMHTVADAIRYIQQQREAERD